MPDVDLKVREKEFRRHPMARCEECPLFPEGEFVPSCGPPKAELAVVGEAPGANEAKAGRPFIGVSGQLLDRVLQHYDIDRKKVLITNATLCRSSDGATPTAKAISACRPRLLWELAQREVETVVACGNSAAQSILATSTGITSLRVGAGRTNEKELPGVRVVPTFHPAAALRMPNFFPSIVTDFGKLKGRHASWYEPDWRAYDDPDIALQALGELERRGIGPVVVDIESQIEKDVSFETPSRHDLLCVGVGYQRGKVVVFGRTALQSDLVRSALRRYLVARPITGQNFKFDAKGLWAKLDKAEFRLGHDTMLSSYCLDERQGVHALDYQAIEKLGAPNWKHALDKYNPKKNGYAAVPPDELYFYNARDIHATDLVAEVNGKALTEEGLWGLHDFLCRASEQLMFIELNGIAIDRTYNRELDRMFTKSLARIRGEIQATIPGPLWEEAWSAMFPARANKMQDFNPNSPVQVKSVVKDIFGMRLPMKMNQKKEYAETTDADALEGLLAKSLGGPAEAFFRGMLDHRKEAKSHGTYVKGIYNRMWHGRVYSTYLLHGTTTGRLSSRNPNLQNITRGSQIRRQFVPARDTNVFVEGDFKQAELRVLCWLAQDEFLRDIFNDPTRDLFDELTPRLYGDVSHLEAPALKELRIRVKAYVYGLSYGREAHSIAMEYNIPVNEAQRGMQEFFRVIPATVAFRENTRRKVLNGDDLITPFGRHRRFWLITNANKKDVMNEALAFLPQSAASDLTLRAATTLRPALKGVGYIRNLVHDSILGECPKENETEMRRLIEEHMLASAYQLVGDYVKFGVDLASGDSWGTLQKAA